MDIRDTITNIFAKVCFFIPHLLLLACIGTTALLCITDNLYYLSKASVILIASALLSIFLIWKGKSVQDLSINEDTINDACQLNIRESTLCKVYAIVFLLAFSWLIFSQARDLPFIVLSVILFSISAVHLFVRNLKYPILILAELFLTAILFCASEVVFHPYTFMGTIDIMPHEVWVQAILNVGTICTLSEYGAFPLMHISGAAIAYLTGLSIHDSLYTLTIAAILIGMPFVYLITKHFTESKRISLFAAFSFLMFGTLTSAVAVFPTGLYVSAFIILLYLFLKNDMPFAVRLILIALTATYMTQVHHATTLILGVVVAILLVCAFLYKREFSVSQIVLGIIALGATGLYWVYGYWDNIVSIVKGRLGWAISDVQSAVDNPGQTPGASETPAVSPTPGVTEPVVPTTPPATGGEITDALIENLKAEAIAESVFPVFQIDCIMSVIIILFLISGLYFILSRKNKLTKLAAIAPLVLVFTPFFIYGIADAFNVFTNVFLIDRWRIFVRPFFAIVIGVGIAVVMLTLSSVMKMKKPTANMVLVLSLILLVIAGPIIHDAKDADIFSKEDMGGKQYYLSDDELNMRIFIEENIPYGSGLVVDYPYCYYYLESSSYANYNVQYFNAYKGTPKYLSLFVFDNVNLSTDDYVVFRMDRYYAKELAPYYSSNTGGVVRITPSEEKLQMFMKNIYRTSSIYTDGNSIISS